MGGANSVRQNKSVPQPQNANSVASTVVEDGFCLTFFFFALVLAVVIAATFLTRKGQAKVMFNGAPVALLV